VEAHPVVHEAIQLLATIPQIGRDRAYLRSDMQCVVQEGLMDPCVVGSRRLHFAESPADLDQRVHEADDVAADGA
jgi:hypothetical protein